MGYLKVFGIVLCSWLISSEADAARPFSDREVVNDAYRDAYIDAYRDAYKFSFADTVEKVADAVVNIRTETPLANSSGSLGSGFIVSKSGLVVTNYHVIKSIIESKEIEASGVRGVIYKIKVNQCGKNSCLRYDADLVNYDKNADLAVLNIKSPKNFPYLKFENSFNKRVGDFVIAVGNPLGQHSTVTHGIISAFRLEEDIKSKKIPAVGRFLQTDALINGGNSGGPLCTLDGSVVGVTTFGVEHDLNPVGIPDVKIPVSSGLSYAIPSEIAKPVVERLAKCRLENGECIVT